MPLLRAPPSASECFLCSGCDSYSLEFVFSVSIFSLLHLSHTCFIQTALATRAQAMAKTQLSFTAALLSILTLWNWCPLLCHASRPESSLDTFLQRLMHCSNIEALSVSLVKDGKKYYERGYEYVDKQIHKRPWQDINEDTVFCLGGATQAFTSVLLASLLEAQENYTMDTTVHEITGSYFQLPGQFRRRRVNLKDILGMRTGISNMDIVATAYGMPKYRLQQNLRYAPEVSQFREEAVYSEVLFSLAADVAEKLGGDTWEQLVRRHIFEPLGMSSATFVHMGVQNNSNVAQPYFTFRDEHHPLHWDALKGQELVRAATSVCASASDMTKWMNFILNEGKIPGNRQLVSKEVIRSTFQSVQTRDPHMIDPNPRISGFSQTNFPVAYTRESNALGWIKGYYRGNPFLSQDGSLPGYESLSTLIPSRGGGVGVFTAFTGRAGGKAYAAKVLINNYALDILKGASPWVNQGDVCEDLKNMAEETDNADSLANSHYPRPGYSQPGNPPVRPLKEYEGKYRNYAFGDVVITYNESTDGLKLHYGELGHYILHASVQNDTFIMQDVVSRGKSVLCVALDLTPLVMMPLRVPYGTRLARTDTSSKVPSWPSLAIPTMTPACEWRLLLSHTSPAMWIPSSATTHPHPAKTKSTTMIAIYLQKLAPLLLF